MSGNPETFDRPASHLAKQLDAWIRDARDQPLLSMLGMVAETIIANADRAEGFEDRLEFDLRLPEGARCSVSAFGADQLRSVTVFFLRRADGTALLDSIAIPANFAGDALHHATWLHGVSAGELIEQAKTSNEAFNALMRSCHPISPTSDDYAQLGESLAETLRSVGFV